ncbi:CoA-transferase family III domain-containing protein [Diplogelasinospora grovesii]|uniref:CoA-transferase family III domain-containing protein n=1 Tax=Diplogelasinospora grovesii TaxID=303347 RepID=A0AAN6MXS9_9PEZI|nr:CoA-transferase family III domain-containing protein [Diplogelasinospora grovesii]
MSGRIPDVYGPGTWTDATFTPITSDTHRIFRHLASITPGFTDSPTLLSKVSFITKEGYPLLPGPLKLSSVAAALHGMAGVVASEILTLRSPSSSPDRTVTIDVTHAALWLASVATVFLDGNDLATHAAEKIPLGLGRDWEMGWHSTPLKIRGTGIYPTRTPGVWYQLHGSLDVPPVLRSIGIILDPDEPAGIDTPDKAATHIAKHTAKFSAEELEMKNLMGGFCGSICWTPHQWNESSMGKSLARHPLVNATRHHVAWSPAPPAPFPPFPEHENDRRPLVGVKVVELTRVIAGPQIGTLLAAFGADVVRVNAPHLPDINTLQLSLNAGKRTVGLDLRDQEDRKYLHDLIKDCDVFVQGFRLNTLNKYGLSFERLVQQRSETGRGLVYVSENCYGPDGYYAERPGWQQIADCASGAAHVIGRALGLPDGECVLPALPVTDMSTGLAGAVATMMALRDRAKHGGSYKVHAALVAVNTFTLSKEVGLYPPEVVRETQERFGFGPMRASHHVLDLLGNVYVGWKRVLGEYLEEDSGLFQSFDNSPFGGRRLSILRPVVRFSDEESSPEWRSPSVPYAYEKKEEVAFR